MTIIPLREAIYHSKLVGSKSANLSVLLQHQIRTVDGIVIVAPYTRTDLQNVWNKMEGAAPLAVRSSMSSEDTEYSSAAGRYETILGVASFEEFVYAVHEVISSGYDAVNKAALVQPLIAGYCSGVLFTQSPISVNAMMIESIYGLGESLVSGKTTPDHFELNRETGVVVKERITNKKTHGIFVSPQPSLEIGHQVEYPIGKVRCTFSFGTKFIGSVSYRGQQSPSLSEEQLIGLYNLGIQLERISVHHRI
ncbi:PEP/pyruvate-binding domain-containing protein [Ectobacillus funiculus]